MPLMYVLKNMEVEGINIDVEALKKFGAELNEDLIRLKSEIIEAACEDFNLDSPRQLGTILFEKMQISSKAKKTKTGQYATSEDVLQKHEKDHPIVGNILNYRQLKKTKKHLCRPSSGIVRLNRW
jgi:DNA polymerase-1